MNAALQAARSAVAQAQDIRLAAADRAMVAVHSTPPASQGEVDRLFAVWRQANDELEAARARLAMTKAAAGLTQVVALDEVRSGLADSQSKTVTATTIHRSVS